MMININLIHYEQSCLLAPAPPDRNWRISQQVQPIRQKIPTTHPNKDQLIRAIKRECTCSQWDLVPSIGYTLIYIDAKIYKQVGGVLIDQSKKEVKTTLTNRIGLIKGQIEHTIDLLKKNEEEQKKMAEKIQKAKERYYEMAQKLQVNQWSSLLNNYSFEYIWMIHHFFFFEGNFFFLFLKTTP